MYKTSESKSFFDIPDHDCLYYLTLDQPIPSSHNSLITPVSIVKSIQIIDYCRRVPMNLSYPMHSSTAFTFQQLKQMNLSSNDLYKWSAPIDVIEDYQFYIDTNLNTSSSHIFYNCSKPWFGPRCQYTFNSSLPFNQIVSDLFSDKLEVNFARHIQDNPCYIHLDCDHGGVKICLDWREICDGFRHCSDGIDERHCHQLEQIQCQSHEYRCQNGHQCIPRQYVGDDIFEADCLDRSDEKHQVDPFLTVQCQAQPGLLCEDTTCPSQSYPFGWPCGDGQCISSIFGCANRRDEQWRLAMLESSELNVSQPDLCRTALSCMTDILPSIYNDEPCSQRCRGQSCHTLMQQHCPDFFDVTIGFTELGPIHLIYRQLSMQISFDLPNLTPDYICIKMNHSCNLSTEMISMNGLSCWHRINLNLSIYYKNWPFLFRKIQLITSDLCSSKDHQTCPISFYRCRNSTKCISKTRLLDGIEDCRYGDDEECFRHDPHLFPCPEPIDVLQIEEDARFERRLSFGAICDGYQHFRHLNATDETDCDLWECNNTYTHCNGFWTCNNGLDELNCPDSSCLPSEHRCISALTNKFTCLPMDRANNNIDDCIGAIDEQQFCKKDFPFTNRYRFRCLHTNICLDSNQICDSQIDCPMGDDQLFCSDPPSNRSARCYHHHPADSPEKTFMCNFVARPPPANDPTLHLMDLPFFPMPTSINSELVILNRSKTPIWQPTEVFDAPSTMVTYCHRGIAVIVQTFNQTKYECFCPPAYYGDRCQYQNERVSLTVSFRAPSNWRTLFTMIITLITDDGTRTIHSKKQIDYLALRDCNTKFDLNLLYNRRPKNLSDHYAIIVDIYIQEHWKTDYFASWFYPIQYNFLPVNRIALLLFIPVIPMTPIKECSWTCEHGHCYSYVNTERKFCRCHPGWSGIRCDQPYECDCANHSNCVGSTGNLTICVCPLNRFGPRCLLNRSICQSNPCLNGGICAASDDHIIASHFTCVCQNGFYGLLCEKRASYLEVHFDRQISIPSNIFLHVVTSITRNHPTQATLISRIPVYDTRAKLFIPFAFHIIFGQMNNQFYLLAIQNDTNNAISLSTRIQPSNRCFSMWNLVDETIMRLSLLDRIKFYHVPCRKKSSLTCFYDVSFMCICDLHRRSNCFKFNYSMSHDCQGNNYCEHQGQCLQDHTTCPTSSVCVCPRCYYGSRCQFSSNSTGVSLDIIFGSHIQPKVSFHQQSSIVKIASIINLLMFTAGMISAILSILTFRRPTVQQIGCGIYLYFSSFTSLLAMITFAVKFWFIVLAQLFLIRHETFLLWQCRLIDYFLRSTLSIGNWLNACVAMERTVTVMSVHFEKKKSCRIARLIVIYIILSIISIGIYDPIHRRLIDDQYDQRLWCVASYSSSMEIFHSISSFIFFLIPYAINLLSPIIIITVLARRRSSLQQQTFIQNLRQQFQEHKTLIISPLISVILSLPQLIFSILPTCIHSMREPWFFLVSYSVAFIPPLMIFPVYVLTSNMYRKEFFCAINRRA